MISLSGNHTDKTYRTEEDVVVWQTQKLSSASKPVALLGLQLRNSIFVLLGV